MPVYPGAFDLTLTADSLQGKQSVRATFRLPTRIIDLLSVAAEQLGLKQKSLFDQLVEDENTLDRMVAEAQDYAPLSGSRRQKTFVISRNSLTALEHVAREHDLSRDLLVEISVKRLAPVITAEQKKQTQRKILQHEMDIYLNQGKKLLRKASAQVGKEDHIYGKLEKLVSLCGQYKEELDNLIEKGKRMDTLA